jgi:uncharacterized iron-regulated membrane protein
MSWITESNRMKHFWYGIPCGFMLTILFVAGLVGQIIQGIALLLMWKGGVI